jgi:hypothetical protein
VKLPDVTGLSVAHAALAYVDAGIPVVPFDPRRGNGKECGNLVGGETGKWYQLVTTDKSQLRSWRATFGRFQALATSPGAIDVVVIDLDRPALWPAKWRLHLKDSSVPFVATRPIEDRRRGHYWFRLPDGATCGNRAFEWGEIRCVGGGLVLPPNGNRIVVRSGVPPILPAEILAVIAGAVGSGASVDLDDFLTRHVTETKPYKLKGLGTLYERETLRTGSRHHGARIALTVGFGESRLGYVSAQKVYDSVAWRWNKGAREFRDLARWCASVAESTDLDELKLKSDRGSKTDSRMYAGHFARKTG